MTKTTMKKREIYAMKPLDEAAEPAILSMRVKQRRESIDMFQKGGREELAEEMKMIEEYMPPALSEEELDAAIAAAMAETGATSAKQMGLVMKAVSAKLAGKRVDGRVLSEKVKGKLG